MAPAKRPSSPSPAQKPWKFQAIKGAHFSEAAELFTGWDVACSSHKTQNSAHLLHVGAERGRFQVAAFPLIG